MRTYFTLAISILMLGACSTRQPDKKTTVHPVDKVFSQTEIMEILLPALKANGQVYKKKLPVLARPARPGERVETRTADGLETVNTAKEGDMLVKNQTEAGEEYLMPADKFEAKYAFSLEADDGFAEYLPTGRAVAMEVTEEFLEKYGLPEEFRFVAAWAEEMVVKKGDYLASPTDHSEVYRIARKEFFETYTEE